jgi:hypothetical protein
VNPHAGGARELSEQDGPLPMPQPSLTLGFQVGTVGMVTVLASGGAHEKNGPALFTQVYNPDLDDSTPASPASHA